MPFATPGDLPDPGIKPVALVSSLLADSLPLVIPGKLLSTLNIPISQRTLQTFQEKKKCRVLEDSNMNHKGIN